MNQVTYVFRDGSKQSTPISKYTFFNEKNKKRSREEVINILKDNMHDLNAVKMLIS